VAKDYIFNPKKWTRLFPQVHIPRPAHQ